MTLLATLPLLFMSGAFENRDTPLRTRSIALTLVALGTLAISILGYVLLNGASAGPLDDGDPFNGIARDARKRRRAAENPGGSSAASRSG